MVIDGAMGTTVQQYKFSEEDFRGASSRVWVRLGWRVRALQELPNGGGSNRARGSIPCVEALLLPHPRAGARQLSQLWAATMKKTEKNPHELTLQERPSPQP